MVVSWSGCLFVRLTVSFLISPLAYDIGNLQKSGVSCILAASFAAVSAIAENSLVRRNLREFSETNHFMFPLGCIRSIRWCVLEIVELGLLRFLNYWRAELESENIFIKKIIAII